MKLTKLQFKLLKLYDRFHRESLTVSSLVRICVRSWLLLLACAALSYWLIVPDLPSVGWLFIGCFVGAFLRDIGRYQVLLRVWPALHEIINWQQVRELIETHEKNVA